MLFPEARMDLHKGAGSHHEIEVVQKEMCVCVYLLYVDIQS